MQIAAHIGPQFVPNCAEKDTMPIGIVFIVDDANSTVAQSNSPHQETKIKIALVATAGSISGTAIL